MAGFAYAMGKVNRKALGSAALTYKDITLLEARKDTGGDLRLSNWGKRGVRLGVGYDVRGYENATAKIQPRPQGPWKVLEAGAKPHPIVRGVTKRQAGFAAALGAMTGSTVDAGTLVGSVKKRKALKLPQGFRYGVNSPGAKAKHTWRSGITKAGPRAIEVFKAAYQRALAEAFK